MSDPAVYINQQFQQQQQQMQLLQEQLMQLQGQLDQRNGEQQLAPIASAVRQPGPRKPEVFNGKKTDGACEAFVEAVDNYLAYYGNSLSNERQVRLVLSLIVGPADTWFRSYRNRELQGANPEDWPALKEILKEHFIPVNATETLRDQLHDLTQRGSVANYVERFCTITNQLSDVSTAEALDRFVRGLKPEVRAKVRLERPDTLHEAMEVADQVDRVMYKNGAAREPFIRSMRPRPSGPVPMELGALSTTTLTQEEKQECLRRGACFHCQRAGHRARQCPDHRRRAMGNGRRQ